METELGIFFPAWHTELTMDTTIADLIKFNEFLDSTLDPNNFDEEFISLRQVELDGISKIPMLNIFLLLP